MFENEPIMIREVDINDSKEIAKISDFLKKNDLELGKYIESFIEVLNADLNQIVACGAISTGGIIKCVAIDDEHRGRGLMIKLMTDLIKLSYEHGYNDMFLFTKPEYEEVFNACGFYTIERAGDKVVLLENSSSNLATYCNILRLISLEIKGQRIGSVVLKADPFTLGHQYLIETAASQCDWLHVFLVKENLSIFSCKDRFQLVKKGIAALNLKNITLHQGSNYIISRTTFPSYFLRDEATVEESYFELDLKIFRKYIAPALNITDRFVGDEPFCSLTNTYNEGMKYWLEEVQIADEPNIKVNIIKRKEVDGLAISASDVRDEFFKFGIEKVKKLVPQTTYDYLKKYNREKLNIAHENN